MKTSIIFTLAGGYLGNVGQPDIETGAVNHRYPEFSFSLAGPVSRAVFCGGFHIMKTQYREVRHRSGGQTPQISALPSPR